MQKSSKAGGSGNYMNILVHPLVIMQMSEHYSRTKVQQGTSVEAVYGALLGKQQGRKVEVINSFTFRMYADEETRTKTFNEEHMIARAEQYSEVFPELQVVGVYCTSESNEMSQEEKAIFLKMTISLRKSEKIDNPLLLKLNAATAGVSRNLPLYAFEGDVVDVDRYCPVEWSLVSEESERIGVNHIARLSTKNGKDEGAVNEKHKKAQAAALDMLLNRVQLIMHYFNEVQAGKLEPDIEVLREANLLAQKLNAIDRYSVEFDRDFVEEDKEIALFSLLPKMTELVGNLSQIWAKVSTHRLELHSDDPYGGKGRWLYQNMEARSAKFYSKYRGDNDEDYLDDDEFENEMSGPRRKIHAADSQQPGPSGLRSAKRDKRFNVRRFDGSRRQTPNRVLEISANNSGQMSTDHEMDTGAANAWGPEDMATGYVPEVPRPSASNVVLEENIDEPQ
ncbi:unnamed protein product [Caenorhabditis bovis]|uniref:COP9 signalosome complex subunit 6 n=1 Tax=Caenorhabditis bovis TaxID=2654633 RepID=A0A8S1FEX2_9PELO|nr:unnamed protein product [Caenorhabditis bovis]